MLLAFLACSMRLACAEPDTTSSTKPSTDRHRGAVDASANADSADTTDAAASDDTTDADASADMRDVDRGDDDIDEDDADDTDRHSAPRVRDLDDLAAEDIGRADEDDLDDAVATERLDDASADSPAPASISEASMATPAPTNDHGIDAREAALRRHTSWLGRFDISLTWRRALNEGTGVRRDEVWVVGTWRL